MFGPNSIVKHSYKMSFSHRTEKFKKLYSECRDLVLKKFNLDDYDLIFVPGPGTTAMEVVISSLKDRVKIVGLEGKFKNRWQKYALYNNKYDKNAEISLSCHLETSTGHVLGTPGDIIDAISSFPYYEIPKNTKCFVTCSNKQLGAFPGLALIFVKKDSWSIFQQKRNFCTRDIMLYKRYAEQDQTPTTCPVQIFQQLKDSLEKFDLQKHKRRINKVCKVISDALPVENPMPCPVINILKENIPDTIALEYEIYNHNNESRTYQIFSYSNRKKKYKEFCKRIKNE